MRRGCSATVPNSSPWIVLSKPWRLPRMLDTLATAQQVRPVPVVRACAKQKLCVNKRKHETSDFLRIRNRRKGHSVLVLCVNEILYESYNTQRMGLICVQFCSPTSAGWGYENMPAICTDPTCCGGTCVDLCAYGIQLTNSCGGTAGGSYSRICPCGSEVGITTTLGCKWGRLWQPCRSRCN